MRMGDDQTHQGLAALRNEGRVRHHHLNLRVRGTAEANPTINGEPAPLVPVKVEVHANLARPAQRQESKISGRNVHTRVQFPKRDKQSQSYDDKSSRVGLEGGSKEGQGAALDPQWGISPLDPANLSKGCLRRRVRNVFVHTPHPSPQTPLPLKFMGPGATAPGGVEGRSPRLAYFNLSNTTGITRDRDLATVRVRVTGPGRGCGLRAGAIRPGSDRDRWFR